MVVLFSICGGLNFLISNKDRKRESIEGIRKTEEKKGGEINRKKRKERNIKIYLDGC